MKTKMLLLSLILAVASHGDAQTFIMAQQYHINDAPNYSREPYGLLWRAENPEVFDKKFGGAIRLTLHRVERDLEASLVPVFDDNSLDMQRIRGWRTKVNKELTFAPEAKVSLHDDNTIWSAVNGIFPEAQIGSLIEPKTAHLCTGEFRIVCGLKLDGQVLRITAPLDWSQAGVTDIARIKVNECQLPDLQLPDSPAAKRKLGFSISLKRGNNTTCDGLTSEMKMAQQIFSKIGIELQFIKESESADFKITVEDKLSLDTSEYTSVSGWADRDKKTLAIGQPTYGRRADVVLAHEIGHVLGLDHVADQKNLMMSAGITNANTELTPAQISILLSH